MSITISKISPSEHSNKVRMMKEKFHFTNPLMTIFNLHNMMPPPDHPSHHSLYIKAEDSEGQTIGLAINRFYDPASINPESEEDHDHVIVNFFRFLEKDAKLDELPEKTVELSVIIVQEEWRRRGVAKMLVEESMRALREAGFQAMRVCCTSKFSARIVRSLGWKEHYRLAYQDYPARSDRNVVINSNPPHNHVYYYWIEL